MSFTCPECYRTSYNPNDEREGFCGACNDWTACLRCGVPIRKIRHLEMVFKSGATYCAVWP